MVTPRTPYSKLKTRSDTTGTHGYVESWEWYDYKGVLQITSLASIEAREGNYIEPHVFKGGLFVPLSEVAQTLDYGVDRYLSSKKPIYSLLQPNSLVVETRIKYSQIGHELVYVTPYRLRLAPTGELTATPVFQITPALEEVLQKSVARLVPTTSDRGAFLRGRLPSSGAMESESNRRTA